MQCCLTNSAKISSRFTDKGPFFNDLSVSKTHFTDKLPFFGDLSVNFCPL
ncbi:prevent-host-death protein [Ligilactobacillus ruminis]